MAENERQARTPEETRTYNRAVIRARQARYQTFKGDMELQAVGQHKPDLHFHFEWEEGVFHHSRTFYALKFPETFQVASGHYLGTCPTCEGDGIFKGRNPKADDDTKDGRTACWTCKSDKVSHGTIPLPSPSTLKLQAMILVAEKIRDHGKEEGLEQVLKIARSEYPYCNKMIKKGGRHAIEHAMLKFWQAVGERAEYLLSDDGAHLGESFLTSEWSADFRTDVANVLSFSHWRRQGLPSWLAIVFMKAQRVRQDA